MNFYGVNVAAFKLPIHVPAHEMLHECELLEPTFLPHNMQLGATTWTTGAIKSALGNWRLSDPAFYRHLPEMQDVAGNDIDQRLEYITRWAYTELASFAPITTEFCRECEDLGAFMTGARFLKVDKDSTIRWHADNNPGKEFRITVGLAGMEEEEFVIRNGTNKWTVIPMKAGEAWFVDISLGHAVSNKAKDNPRYRLGMQFYAPVSQRLLEMFVRSDRSSIIYSEQLKHDPGFDLQ